MRITQSNITPASQWAHMRMEESSASPRERPATDRAREAAVVAELRVLDSDRDGWLDEDDVPYDHLVLRERELWPSKGDAEVGAVYTRAAATPAPVPAGEARSAEADPKMRGDATVGPQAGDGARVGPQIDLLA